MSPLVPAGTMAALAMMVPGTSFKVETSGRVWPGGQTVMHPSPPRGPPEKFGEQAWRRREGMWGVCEGKGGGVCITSGHNGGVGLHAAIQRVQGGDQRLVFAGGPDGEISQLAGRDHGHIERIGCRGRRNVAAALLRNGKTLRGAARNRAAGQACVDQPAGSDGDEL